MAGKRANRTVDDVKNAIRAEVAELRELGLTTWVRTNPKTAIGVVFVFGFLVSLFGGGEVATDAVNQVSSFGQ